MMTTRNYCLLFHKRSTDWDSPLGYKQVISHYTRRISLLLTLVLSFTSDSYNNNDILLVVGYNYDLFYMYKFSNKCIISKLYFPKSPSGWVDGQIWPTLDSTNPLLYELLSMSLWKLRWHCFKQLLLNFHFERKLPDMHAKIELQYKARVSCNTIAV